MQEQPGFGQQSPQQRRCAFCSAPLEESARYCPACGHLAERAAPDVDISGWVKTGWDLFAGNIGPAIAIPLVMLGPVIGLFILTYVGFFATAIVAGAGDKSRGDVVVLTFLGITFGLLGLFLVLVVPALQAGIYACFLDGVRSGRPTAARLGDGFRHWWACGSRNLAPLGT